MAKHLTLDDRENIQSGLNEGRSLRSIAKELQRAISVISREVRTHRSELNTHVYGRVPNRCIHRKECSRYGLCIDKPNCTRNCAACKVCNSVCPEFAEELCSRLIMPPYVCNGCINRLSCVLRKQEYKASVAQKQYKQLLHDARFGFNMDEGEFDELDSFVSPLMRQGQSVSHIVMTQKTRLNRSASTLYRMLHSGILSARPIDAPRICRLHVRSSLPNPVKVDKACRIGRSLDDFKAFISANPDVPIVEMDSVIGRLHGKVLMTLHLLSFDFMLAILRDRNTSASVTAAMSHLRNILSPELFFRMFPVLLTDNGTEFSDPTAIEFPCGSLQHTRVFYCDPNASFQKPHVELNHTHLRRCLPKGTSFDSLTQDDISLMMSHINSYVRKKFMGQSPSQLFVNAFGEETLHLLGQTLIPPEK